MYVLYRVFLCTGCFYTPHRFSYIRFRVFKLINAIIIYCINFVKIVQFLLFKFVQMILY